MAGKKTPSIFSTLQKTTENASAVNGELVRQLPVSALMDNPLNRFSMNEDDKFRATLASVERDGILEDVIVTPGDTEGTWRIVSGHRRVIAAKKLGRGTVPCKVRSYPDRLSELRTLMSANLIRRDFSPFDMALQLETLRDVLREERLLPEGVKEQAELLAEQTRLSRATVERYLDLLNLDETLMGWARAGQMTMTDAYELARKSSRPLYATVEAYVQGASDKSDMPGLVHSAIRFAKLGEAPPVLPERGTATGALRAVDSFGRSLRRSTARFKELRFDGETDREAARKKLDTCLTNLDELRQTVESLRRELDE